MWINSGLRFESVTLMALKYSYHGVIDGNIRMNKWRIMTKKNNTDGVERNHLQNKMCGNTTQYL